MINDERKKEVIEKLKERYTKNSYNRAELTDEEAEKQYQEQVRSMLIPTPSRYRDVKAEDIPKNVLASIPLPQGKNGYYIWGDVGTGKTHTLYAMRVHFAERLTRLKIVNMSELFASIKKSFSEKESLDFLEEASYYNGFDDVGTEKDTEWAGEQMYRLVNNLYENKKHFVFTSNHSLKELAGRFGEQGDRIASRIAEMCEVIEIKGKDRRI